MGRKSQSKQGKKNGEVKNNKFVLQRRKDLAILVDRLLKLTSIFQASTNLAQNWQHHLEIEGILNEVRNIEGAAIGGKNTRQSSIDKYLKWLNENGAQFEGVEIAHFEGYDLGLKATKPFPEGSLVLTVPSKVMMTENNAKDSELSGFFAVDPLLQNMPNILLALFLLLEKNNPDSFWRPYIDILPDKYSTVLYFTSEELAELKPSPVFETSLKLCRSITRQYAYFYNKIHTLDIPVMKKLQDIFTYDNYRWAVSTVMTRQNNIQIAESEITAFIPLWDMCNHEQGKITTDFNKELGRGECFALRDFGPGDQIFIYYGVRPNADLFLHNGFVYPNNEHDSLALALGISSSDPLRENKYMLLKRLGLAGLSHYSLHKGSCPLSAELLAFIRIFNMNQEDLAKWCERDLPCELVSPDAESAEVVGTAVDRRAYTYLLTRCRLIKGSYKMDLASRKGDDNQHRKNVQLLKESEVQILDDVIKYLQGVLEKLPTEDAKETNSETPTASLVEK